MPQSRHYRLFIIAFVATAALASGCSAADLLDLEPEGPIASKERTLLLATFGLMLLVLIPILVMTLGFAWNFRASNTNATYAPKWESSIRIELAVWLIPAAIVAVLAALTWIYTHRLNPYKPLDPGIASLEVQVIALDWKWLFIYPKLDIATVNRIAVPVDMPVSFAITSDTVMNSFFIPQLGGQIYAMAGMQTELHLLADKPGTYFGENTQYSGRGFPYQHFDVLAMTRGDFNGWVAKVKQSPNRLEAIQFQTLERPSVRHPVTFYGSVAPGLFDQVIHKFSSATTPPVMPGR